MTFLSIFGVYANASTITTSYSSVPKDTNEDEYILKVKSAKGSRRYHIYSQSKVESGSKNYIKKHGCACCALTSLISSYSTKYSDYDPWKISQILEKKALGTTVWKKNYSKKASQQMPISLYGISKVLKYCGIKSSYVRYFKNASAVKAIEKHLRKGYPVIVEVANQTQKNGITIREGDTRWATTKHTLLLVGITNKGKAIVADSANRSWSGNMQRVKLVDMDELVQYMYPCTKTDKSVYFKSASSGGYILVKE